MAEVVNTSLLIRKVDCTMVDALFRRATDWIWPKLCGSVQTTSEVEPYAIIGSAPQMKFWNGSMNAAGLPSWTITVPNQLMKNILLLDRQELERDQTKSLYQKAGEIGVTVGETPEQLWTYRLITGDQPGSATMNFKGKSYPMTIDGEPQFSANHTLDGVTLQSNIIAGSLPNTVAAVQAMGVTAAANAMQTDLTAAINAIQTVADNQNRPIYPTIDQEKSIVVIVPPALKYVGVQAFKASGTLGGTAGQASGSTTSIAPLFVKDLMSSGYLAGLPDPTVLGTSLVRPSTPTTYWIAIVNDRVKPFYFQTFRPPNQNELFPQSGRPSVDSLLSGQGALKLPYEITRDMANLYTSTVVDTNLGAVGANGQLSVAQTESFFISGRWNGNMAYGPWFTIWQIDPVSGSV